MGKGNKQKFQNNYLLDNNLLPRVRMLIATLNEEDLSGGHIDTDMMCDLLKEKHKEYQRRPGQAFQQSVDRGDYYSIKYLLKSSILL